MKLFDKVPKQSEAFFGVLERKFIDGFSEPQGFVEINIWEGPVGSNLFKQVMAGYTPVSKNLVVNLARRIMSRMLSGAVPDQTPANPTITLSDTTHPSYPNVTINNVSELFITKMMWGTGGHNPSNPTEPIDPTADDEQLNSPLSSPTYKAVTVDYPAEATVRFSATLEQSEANGEGISEVGLFTDQHTLMFSRKTFGILTKSSDFSFEFRYSILY